MKCEICHNAEAETVLLDKKQGRSKELYVCKECASKASSTRTVRNEEGHGGNEVVGMLLGAAFDVIGETIRKLNRPQVDPSCPACGITRNEWRKDLTLGCPVCWKTFEKELEREVAQVQGVVQHVGKAPCRFREQAEADKVERSLKEAIDREDFEEAIRLRNRLSKLSTGKKAK